MVSRVFTPWAVTALEPMIREVIGRFLDRLNDADEFDAVADFAAPFPVEVISRMLGVPESKRRTSVTDSTSACNVSPARSSRAPK